MLQAGTKLKGVSYVQSGSEGFNKVQSEPRKSVKPSQGKRDSTRSSQGLRESKHYRVSMIRVFQEGIARIPSFDLNTEKVTHTTKSTVLFILWNDTTD